MEREEELLLKHLNDLAERAHKGSRPVFSDFLNAAELSLFTEHRSDYSFVGTECFGGFSMAERQMICFYPDNISITGDSFPIECLKVSPLNKKFADKLTHRDFLGALVNTGIDRCKLGDIIVSDNEAYFFCSGNLGDYLSREITRVKHTSVMLSPEDCSKVEDIFGRNFDYLSGSVSSLRADAVVALAIKGSRSKADDIIAAKKLFVNSVNVTKKDYNFKVGDIFSIRGYGKFVVEETGIPNSKNRFKLTLKVYR